MSAPWPPPYVYIKRNPKLNPEIVKHFGVKHYAANCGVNIIPVFFMALTYYRVMNSSPDPSNPFQLSIYLGHR